MNSFAFLVLLASFALCLLWYIQNYEGRSDGERGLFLRLRPDKEDEPVEKINYYLRGADAVKKRAEELGIAAKSPVATPVKKSRAERIKDKAHGLDQSSSE